MKNVKIKFVALVFGAVVTLAISVNLFAATEDEINNCIADDGQSLNFVMMKLHQKLCPDNTVKLNGIINVENEISGSSYKGLIVLNKLFPVTIKCETFGCGLKYTYSGLPSLIYIASNYNKIDGLSISAPNTIPIIIDGDNNNVVGVKVSGATGACLRINEQANDNFVEMSVFNDCSFGSAIDVAGKSNTIINNNIGLDTGIYGSGIAIGAINNIVADNTIKNWDAYGIYFYDSVVGTKDAVCANKLISSDPKSRYTNVAVGEVYFGQNGICIECVEGQVVYNGQCVDACDNNEVRNANGECVLHCPYGQVESSGKCVCEDSTKVMNNAGQCVVKTTSDCGANEEVVDGVCECKIGYGRYSDDVVDGAYLFPCVKCGPEGMFSTTDRWKCECGARAGYVRDLRGACKDESYFTDVCADDNAYVDGTNCRCNDGFVNIYECPAGVDYTACPQPYCKVIDLDAACAACLAKGKNFSCDEDTGSCSEGAGIKKPGDCKCNMYAQSAGPIADFLPMIFIGLGSGALLVWRRWKRQV